MAKSAAERTREFRARQQVAAKAKLLDAVAPPSYLQRPFSEFISGKSLGLDENLDAFGVHISGDLLISEVQKFSSQFERDLPLSSLERAVGLVDVFLDAAAELAEAINAYKLAEISSAIERAEQTAINERPDDISKLRAAFDEIARLKAIQTSLRTPTRRTFPTWAAKAEHGG